MAKDLAANFDVQAKRFDGQEVLQVLATDWAKATLILSLALGVLFWPLISSLPGSWFYPDSLYSHGPLIPLLSGAIIWLNRDRLARIPVKGVNWSLLLLIPILYGEITATRGGSLFTSSVCFLAAILVSVLFSAGWGWTLALLPAILYNSFALPLWKIVVDSCTQPLQRSSTEMAFQILKAIGYSPIRIETNVIALDHYTLNVAVACSGSKLTLSLFALAVFFVLAYRPKLWGVVVMLGIVLPLAILVNGFRIALIGVVGNSFGQSVGQEFHDYGGYIALIVCMFILRAIVRFIGGDTK